MSTEIKPLEINIGKNYSYAGFNIRLTAWLIDLSLIGILFFPLFVIISSAIYDGKPSAGQVINEIMHEMKQQRVQDQPIPEQDLNILKNPKFQEFFIKNHGIRKFLIDQLIQVVITLGVILFFWIKRNQTPGKRIMGLIIVDSRNYTSPKISQYFIRLISYFAAGLFFFIGFIWLAIDKKKQGWHDKFAHTVVLKKIK